MLRAQKSFASASACFLRSSALLEAARPVAEAAEEPPPLGARHGARMGSSSFCAAAAVIPITSSLEKPQGVSLHQDVRQRAVLAPAGPPTGAARNRWPPR